MFHPNRQAVRPTDPYQSRVALTSAGEQAVADVAASMGRWHMLAGIDASGLGAAPTLHSDGRWYCSYGVGAGRVAMRYGLGDVSSDMEVFNSAIDIGDGFLANGQYQQAVATYIDAGKTGVTLIGPDVDGLTNGASVGFTQQAWAINGNLAAVTSDGSATQADAESAQGFIRQMQNLYAQGAAMQPAGTPLTQPSSDLVAAAKSLVAAINASGCNGIQDVVGTFQTTYDAEGQVILKIDKKYGPMTQAALQRVLDNSGGGTAPAACHFGGGGSKTTTTTTTGGGVSSGHGWLPWVLGGAVVAGGGLLLVVANKKKHR